MRRNDVRFALSAAALAFASGTASAQIDSFSVSGGVCAMDVDLAPIESEVSFRATRVYSYAEGTCRRLVMIGDVRIRIAEYDLRSRRASVWIQPSSEDGARKILIYLSEFGNAAESVENARISADELPVRAHVIPIGGIQLSADLLLDGSPSDSGSFAGDGVFASLSEGAFMRTLEGEDSTTGGAEDALAQTNILDDRILPLRAAQREERFALGLSNPFLPDVVVGVPSAPKLATSDESVSTTFSESQAPSGAPSARTADRVAPVREMIISPRGTITIAPKDLTYVSGETENSLIASGGVTVQYTEPGGRAIEMRAQRAVIFFDAGQGVQATQIDAGTVRGIYLEGEVSAGDGRYTLRAPQMYYDVKANRAVALDAVFWTYDEQRKLPLYVRAKAIHQEASAQFSARNATLTNTAFLNPELSIGASSVTISRKTTTTGGRGALGEPTARQSTVVDAKGIVGRVAGVPVAYLPGYKGDIERFPVRDLRIENYSGSGASLRATWDIYSLVGLERNKQIQADLLTDIFAERGVGLGTEVGWKTDTSDGSLYAWTLPGDRGVDVLKSGSRINRDGDTRGVLLLEHRQKVDDNWTILAEIAMLSDETVVDAFFEGLGETRREYTNRLVARRIRDNSILSAEMKGTVNDFISNEYLLQSRGYSTTKALDIRYARFGDDLLETSPGLLTYFSEYRAGYVGTAMDEVFASERGLSNNFLSQRALGINFDQRLGDALRARGLEEDLTLRADTRHELAVTADYGPVRLNPFVVARATGYDGDFDTFAGEDVDSGRIWSAAGLRVSTTLQHISDGAESRIFDVHRLRHIVEPHLTIWGAGTTLESQDIPVYDESVENLADGTTFKIGVTQTLQTQRGAPGAWHNTDLITWKSDYVVSSDDSPRRSPLGRFLDYRPELSNPGEYFVNELAWRTTDSFTVTATSIYDVDLSQQSMAAAGVLIQHSPQFSTVAEIRHLDPVDSTLLTLGARYTLTTKYEVFAGADYNTDSEGFQNTAVQIQRRFPSASFGLGIGYNDITGETSLSFVFRPLGAAGNARISGIGASETNSSAGGF